MARPRIIYALPTKGAVQGGHKVIIRHVEALQAMGFNAYCTQGATHSVPDWLDHTAPFLDSVSLREDDIVVVPDDAAVAIRALVSATCQVVVLSQNPYYLALLGFAAIDLFPPQRVPRFFAVSKGLKSTILRAYPKAEVDVIPCFVDERIFKPLPGKDLSIAYVPRKRPREADFIKAFFHKFYPHLAGLEWVALKDMREPEVAQVLGRASLFLSLSRLESVGMTTLEAMACRCVCAGFTGVGGSQYATPENGFWVADDDCEAAADALAKATGLVLNRSPALEGYLAAGEETASRWSHTRFRDVLEAVWMRLAPEARSA